MMLGKADAPARRAFGWFMLLALVVLAAGIGLRDPWPPDEPRFALMARQMLESGQWLFPHRGQELYSDKPPLLMWCEAALFGLSGGWRAAFLLPSLLAGLGTLGVTYWVGRRLWDARTGLAAAGLLLASFQFVEVVKHAQIDPLLLFFVTLGNAGLLLHCLRGPDWRACWLGCFAAGLGVVAKGVGVLALLMLLPYAWARWRGWAVSGVRDVPAAGSGGQEPAVHGGVASGMDDGEPVVRDRMLRRGQPPAGGDGWRWAAGALAFLLPILAWLLPMLATALGSGSPERLAYVQDLLFRQTAQRYADSWQHVEPPWYFLGVMLADWLPVSLLIPLLLPRWRRALREREARVLLPLAWWLLVLLFFSLTPGKREIYLLPALPMAALAMAPYAEELLRRRWLQRAAFGLAVLAGALALAAGAWALLGQPHAARRIAAGYELADGGRALWWCVIAAGTPFLLAAALCRPRRGVAALLAGIAAAWVVWPLATYPLLDANQSARALMARADARIGPDGQLGLVLWREELLLQARRPVAEFGFSRPWEDQLRDALAWQAQRPGRWILLDSDAMGDCVDKARAWKAGVANRNEWWMFDAAAVRPACRPPGGAAAP
ncbi:4-amino-4-deoxy-L-arabinose transferase-like glycosyltransferase [Fulvimonas soli]|uniref:4-amino-4-deoxy-L-arabinose transferase-like glycosyltransferase n=2 Tax=Fulvimonas soli TaxID=155197 RepID=A0A316IAM0_9GAMM|nr:glycosyltransferase family 39 protein [Fulvimonas soli]PWK84349.1 4-amino-4-deoxy-L-arabinose transferase-like glycosyltransferase [Fulvimonas soli]